jgi:outer membrane protein OmpA-like peptidoglycan-associated protein
MLAPIIMGFLSKTLKAQGSFNSNSLTTLLLGQKDHIKAALPSGVTNLLGVSDIENLGRQAVQVAAVPAKKIWPWIALIIAAVVLFFLWRSCSTQEVTQKATEAAKQAATAAQGTADKAAETAKQAASAVQDTAGKVADQARDAWAALGKFFSKKLPSGVELNIPELGVENKLIAFVEDPQRSVDDKTWFSFDRLIFETGKATLKPESQEQLKNIAEILKAYSKVTIKIGGYTDNTGDPQANLRLSQQRADAVMADLVKLGVEAGRLKAEGYGQEHPIADNSTEEGRAKNRRIDIRVISK